MRISESMLRKIIREEVESMNEMDPTAASAISAGVSGALGLSPTAQQVLVTAIAGMGGFAAAYKMYPGLEKIVSKIPGLLEKIKKATGFSSKNESMNKKNKLIKEGLDPETIQSILHVVAAGATAGTLAYGASEYLEGIAKMFGIKPDTASETSRPPESL